MALESATYISDLVPANPDGTDPISVGDDHIRMIKNVLKTTFPGANGPVPIPLVVATAANQNPIAIDNGKTFLFDTSGGNRVVTLPDSSLVTLALGYSIGIIKKTGDVNTAAFGLSGSDVCKGGGNLAMQYPWQVGYMTYIGLNTWQYESPSRLGAMQDFIGSANPAGSIFMDGGTIGNAGSSATNRASADCEGIYHVLWRSLADSEAPVTGGRGASAAADWNGNKPIKVPDLRSRVAVGKDDMGGQGASGRITAGLNGFTPTTLGVAGGAEGVTLTTQQGPPHTHPAVVTDPGHLHGGIPAFATFGSGGFAGARADASANSNSAFTGITVAVNANNGGAAATPHANVQPVLVVNKIMWLF